MLSLQKMRGHTSQVKVAGNYTEAAVLVGIMPSIDGPSVLLTKRASHLTLHAGESAFPGGKRDPEDLDLLSTALREAHEEVGLPKASFEFLFSLDESLTRTDIKMTPFVGLIPANLEFRPNPHEIADIFTVPLAYFCDSSNLRAKELTYRGLPIRSPSFHYGGHDIWGATAKTLIDLVNIAFDAQIDFSYQ